MRHLLIAALLGEHGVVIRAGYLYVIINDNYSCQINLGLFMDGQA